MPQPPKTAERAAARDARRLDSQDAGVRTAARLRDRPLHRRQHRRSGDRRGRLALPGPLSHGAARLDRGRVGHVRARPAREVLSPHRRRVAATGRRDGHLASLLRRASRRSCSPNETLPAFVVVARAASIRKSTRRSPSISRCGPASSIARGMDPQPLASWRPSPGRSGDASNERVWIWPEREIATCAWCNGSTSSGTT